ncbi:hypothetical protein ACRAVF_19330 [Bradyrhizobium oligotrophicum S58]
MISLDELRERLYPAKKPERKLDWSKWIGSPTAWLALILSGTTAYLTLRKYDDLQVVLRDSFVIVYSDYVKPRLSVHNWGQDLILINSGTRPIAINEVALRIWFDLDSAGERDCEWTGETNPPISSYTLVYKLQPFIVRPSEMVQSKLTEVDQIFVNDIKGFKGFKISLSARENLIDKNGSLVWDLSELPTFEQHNVFGCLLVSQVRAGVGMDSSAIFYDAFPHSSNGVLQISFRQKSQVKLIGQ